MEKLILVGLTLMLCMIGADAAAHVNWFVESDAEPLANFNVTDTAFLIWLCLAFLMVLFSVWLDGKLPTLRIADTKLRHDFMEILRVFTGMSFLLTAYEGSLVAPHKVAEGSFGLILVVMQAIIGIMLIANRWIKTAALLMLVLHVGVTVKFGLFPALEYGMIIGVACFLLLNSIEDETRRDLLKPYSVDALRIWTGISLVALAVGEKLAPSAMGQVFVAQYQWNFMQALGITFFDDRLFVLSAGMVEAVLGIVLILGTTVRLAVLALSVMMAVSNIVFVLQGNNEAALVEFIGHMPLIGVALLLLLLGYGQRLKITDAFSWTGVKSGSRDAPNPNALSGNHDSKQIRKSLVNE